MIEKININLNNSEELLLQSFAEYHDLTISIKKYSQYDKEFITIATPMKSASYNLLYYKDDLYKIIIDFIKGY